MEKPGAMAPIYSLVLLWGDTWEVETRGFLEAQTQPSILLCEAASNKEILAQKDRTREA